MSEFAEAAADIMRRRQRTMSIHELWSLMCEIEPDLAAASENRKTPRATCMRDLRADPRFVVAAGNVTLLRSGSKRRS